MAAIDSLLKLAQRQGADELRLAVGKPPQMFAHGAPTRLSVPATDEATLRILLDTILTPEIERELSERGASETTYASPELGAYRVKFRAREGGGFVVVIAESGTAPAAPAGTPPAGTASGARESAAKGGVVPGRDSDSSMREAAPGTARGAAVREMGSAREAAAVRGPGSARDAAATRDTEAPRALGTSAVVPPLPATEASPPASFVAAPARPERAPMIAPPRGGGRAARTSSKLTAWLQQAVEARASDLHIAEGDPPYIRVDGVLEQLNTEVVHDLSAILPLDAAQLARLTNHDSIDTAVDIAGVGRVRVHVYVTDAGPVAALRLLIRAAPSFPSLNMPVAFDDLIDLPHGLVLVCGAAGAGKSTTLAALVQEALYRRSIVLVTLEDPIEYVLTPSPTSLVRRRQIGRDVKDFASGLRDALRADPDVLLIGEIRDPETAALALTAAETGHLVLASVHSRSAASAIERIVDAAPAEQQSQVRIQLAESLRAVVSQRLLRRRNGTGRLPAIELLRVNRAIASLIRDGKSAQIASVLQSSSREGMLVLERSLADRVQAGEIELEDAQAAANDPEVLSILLKR